MLRFFISDMMASAILAKMTELQKEVGYLLVKYHCTIATAESCTGGLIGSLITDVSGSSDYYLGSVIAYANSVKQELLGVKAATLATVGAVSSETALQMARGVRRLLGADYALATTGIAGPTGGTAEKPVGLVYIALVGPGIERCERHIWDRDRIGNKILSAQRAIEMLAGHLNEQRKEDPVDCTGPAGFTGTMRYG